MSEVGKQQGQSELLLSSITTDKIDYNAETEADDSNENCEREEKANFKPEFTYRNQIQQVAFKMYFIFKEVALMMFLAFTYAALTNDPPKISKSPAAFPFFPKTSVITDWYRGELSAAIDKARESDIAFVMFYAPWDAESQAVRQEFDLAARYMQKQITFAAVNCWQPGSECRRQYTKAYNWPVLIAYPSHGKGIQYKGPRTAAHIVKFLMGLSRPVIRLTSEAEVHGLLASYDAVIVGCVNALPGSLDYAVLYTASLRFLERDPFQEVAFAVLTGLNTRCFDAASPSLTLHMWNETLWYPSDGEWRPDALLMWILKNMHQVSMWISPTGSKSLALSTYLQPGPALILFTPRNPLEPFVDYYDLLHEIGLEYYNCNDKHRVMLNSLLIHTKRIENYLKYTYLLKSCPLKSKIDKDQSFPSVITYTVPKKWANNSCCLSSSKIPKDTCSKCDAMDLLKERLPTQCKRLTGQEECVDVYQHKPLLKGEHDHTKCDRDSMKFSEDIIGQKLKTSIIGDEYDPRLPINLKRLWEKEKCRIANIAQSIFPTVFSDSVTDSQKFNKRHTNISGLACKTNASLTLIAVDSLKYYHFAERLGIDLSTRKDKTVAVIINEKMETHHIMQEPLNDKTLREFIFNFTVSNLPRAFTSLNSIKQKHTHVYPSQINCRVNKSEPCLLELNTETFLPTVMQQDKAVMVLYYSKQCSFCNGISYTFLRAAKILSSISSVWFTRIDGDLNALPWEFTMDSYPTIIFFPARRKSESRAFPRTMPITVPNLVSFILANLNPTLKLHAMWTLCNQTKFEDEKQKCIASVRAENLSIIDHTLRAWRNADLLTKTKLLYKLQQLRNLNLLLAHSPQNTRDIQRHMTRLHLAPLKEVQYAGKDFENKKKLLVKDEL